METLQFKFTETIPDELDEMCLYISMEYRTAIHLCVCGCKNEVVTPFSPFDWSLKFDGDSISLNPSIGNWSFPCKSHYWIIENRIQFAEKWNQQRIDFGRKADRTKKNEFYNQKTVEKKIKPQKLAVENPGETFFEKLKKLFGF